MTTLKVIELKGPLSLFGATKAARAAFGQCEILGSARVQKVQLENGRVVWQATEI